MYKLQDWAAVQKVYKQTGSKRKTAELLHMSRNTVRSLLKQAEEPAYNSSHRKSCIDPFLEDVINWRGPPYYFNGTRIFRELQKIGYTGSAGPLYRLLKKIESDIDKTSSKATERVETPPGDQAQFDWAEYSMVVGGSERIVYCFSMILAASRKKAICFSLKCDAEAIYEAIQELFEDLGGITWELLIDNPRALVIENDPKSEEEIQYNPYALLLAKHLGTELNACPYYWPRKKGKIERPFKYIEEQFVKGNVFASMEELNRRGKEFIDKWCDEVHTTTQRIPNQHYLLEEKATLQPLPKKRFRMKELESRIVSPDCFISFGANKYSVPAKYADKTVKVRMVYGFRIEVYDRGEKLVLTMEKLYGKKEVRTDPEHYAEIATPVSTSIPQIRRDFTARFSNGQRYLEAAGKKFDQPTHHARKIMLLSDLYDDKVLDLFIGYCISQDKMDIKSFKGLLRDYNAGTLLLTTIQGENGSIPSDSAMKYREDDPGLLRECSYYESNTMGVPM